MKSPSPGRQRGHRHRLGPARGRADVLIIEQDPDLWPASAGPRHHLGGGDACEVSSLDAAGLSTVDWWWRPPATTRTSGGVPAGQAGICRPRVVARVNHPKNQWLFTESWGSTSRCPPPSCSRHWSKSGVVGSLVRLLRFEGATPTCRGDPGRGLAGRRYRLVDLGVPRDATVVAVVRDDRLIVPRATPGWPSGRVLCW